MRRATSLTLALLFLATVLPANSQSAGAEGDASVERVVVVSAGAPLTVECALRVEERAAWRLDGHAVPRDLAPQGERAGAGAGAGTGTGTGGVSARLHAAAARPAHRGVYTCGAGPAAQRVRVRVTAPDAATPARAPARAPAGADSAAPPAPAPVPGAGAGPAAGLGAEGDNITLVYELRGPLVLDCTDLVSGGAAQEYKWSVNGTALESLSAAGRARLVLDASGGRLAAADGRAQDADHGRYECAAGGTARVWAVRQRYYAKLPPYTNVVEEQPLKLACRVVGGTPAAGVAWYYSNDTELAFNRTAMKQLVVGDVVKILDGEHGLRNALLQLTTTVREDAGKYWCVPEDEAGVGEALQGLAAGTVLRVKDMYAALWPFLGICAEVFVLCAVILVYERRRTKPELDDSDTDNHDQKKS